MHNSVNITVYARVIRVNEFSPTFSPTQITLSLKEDVAVGTEVLVLNASDLDSGPDGNITYSIVPGASSGLFSLSGARLLLANGLDFEQQSSIVLSVKAVDHPTTGSPKTSNLNLAINLIDVNDNQPQFTSSPLVLEIPDNAVVGIQAAAVTATDRDSGPNGQLEYRMTSNSSALFRLDKDTGGVIPVRSLDLDSLGLDSKTLSMAVFVTDKGSPVRLNNSVNVTLKIVSVNEYSPVLSHPAEITMQLSNQVQIGNTVLQINATDADYGLDGRISYTITAGNSMNVFTLDNSTGKRNFIC